MNYFVLIFFFSCDLDDAIDWSVKGYTKSITSVVDYPYVQYTHSSCLTSSITGAHGYLKAPRSVFTGYETELGLAQFLGNVKPPGGPVTAALCASTLQTYTGGIITPATCCTSVSHAVQFVGVDTSSPYASSQYYKMRNTWGSGWGENGYFRIQYNTNTCAVMNKEGYVPFTAPYGLTC